MRLTLLPALGLMFVLSAGAQTAGKAPEKSALPKSAVAITPLEGHGLAAGEGETMTDALRSYLINTDSFRVMERGKMDVILKEQGFQQSGACTDEACIVEMGQLLGVDKIVTGSVGKVGGTYSVNLRIISVKTSEILKTVNRFHKGEIDGLLTQVIPDMTRELAGIKGSAPQAQPVSTDATSQEPAAQKSSGGHKWLWIGGGAVVVTGVVVFLVIRNNKKNQPGSVEVSW